MAVPTDTIDKLDETFQAIGQMCAGPTEEQWKTPTDLPNWTVQDNLSHLIGTEAMLQGMPHTEHRAADMSHTKNPIGESNEHEVDVRRSMSGGQVLASGASSPHCGSRPCAELTSRTSTHRR